MDAEYISAMTGMIGLAVGGFTSLSTVYLTQRAQLKERLLQRDYDKRDSLFAKYMLEASRLYGDALSHKSDNIVDIVQLYALLANIRLIASEQVVAAAESSMDLIIDAYLAPNRSLSELRITARAGEMNFLRDFADACRSELLTFA